MKKLLYLIALLLLSSTSIASTHCPSTFNSFLALFQSNPSFQTGHIHFPLIYSYVDSNTLSEPKVIKQKLTKQKYIKFKAAHYPSTGIEQKFNLIRKITTTPNGFVQVRFDKPDSDVFSFEYKFVINNGCWQLIEVNNQSL